MRKSWNLEKPTVYLQSKPWNPYNKSKSLPLIQHKTQKSRHVKSELRIISTSAIVEITLKSWVFVLATYTENCSFGLGLTSNYIVVETESYFHLINVLR